MKLSEKAMLVKLSISQWGARKTDKKASEAVTSRYGNTEESGRYSKSLIAREAIRKVSRCASAARQTHYKNTLPWDDDGKRILPAANFQDYTAVMREHRKDFERSVASLVSNYPALVHQARVDLNGLFNPEEYPEPEKIKDKYNFDVTVDPLPDAEDFRVALNNDEVTNIQRQIIARTELAQKKAMQDLWERVHTAVSHMAEKLGEPDAVFRDSLIGNLRDLCTVLPKLNIADDPNLEKLRMDIEEKLLGYTPQELRNANENSVFENPRGEVADSAKDILDAMGAYMGA